LQPEHVAERTRTDQGRRAELMEKLEEWTLA
jgi:hypothetical protein